MSIVPPYLWRDYLPTMTAARVLAMITTATGSIGLLTITMSMVGVPLPEQIAAFTLYLVAGLALFTVDVRRRRRHVEELVCAANSGAETKQMHSMRRYAWFWRNATCTGCGATVGEILMQERGWAPRTD